MPSSSGEERAARARRDLRQAVAGAVALACALSPSLARAHDFWIERASGGFALRAGHRDAPRPVELSRVTSARCARGDAAPVEVRDSALAQGAEVRVAAICDALVASLDHGYWSLTPDGEVNRPRSQVAAAVKAWRARSFAKWVDAGSAAALRPQGAELELVPARPLSGVRSGDKLALRVLAAGAPVAGAVVSVGHRPIGETDSAGEVRVRVREPGLQILSASLRRPVHHADADTEVLEASLSFEVAR